MSSKEIKDVLDHKPIIGTERILKNLKTGKLKKILVASNCREQIKKDINYYAKLADVKVIQLDIPNDEVGLVCKKPFSISVLGY